MMIGAPGAGKGTIAELLAKELQIPTISTGDILREEAQTNQELKEIMDQGKLVPDEFVSEIVIKRLQRDDCKSGFILDGFPRTTTQAEFLDKHNIQFDHVLDLEVSEKEVIKRLGSRRICKSCNSVFNIVTNPPKQENICDKCNGELYTRDDDKPESIKHRLEVYQEKTKTLLDFYKQKGNLKEINADPAIEEVFKSSLGSIQ